MQTLSIGDVVSLVLMGVIAAAVMHAGLYNKHRKRLRNAITQYAGHDEPPKRGDRVRLLVGIPDLKLAPGTEGRITFVDRGDETVYFMAFGDVTSVVFYEHEAWRFEVIR